MNLNMHFDDLNKNNFVLYAIQNYYRPNFIDKAEFYRDLNHLKYLKRVLNSYLETGKIKERLALNHIVILSNVFRIEAAVRIVFLKMGERFYSQLKTLLVFLNFMPEIVYGVDGKNIINSDIPLDINLVKVLREMA